MRNKIEIIVTFSHDVLNPVPNKVLVTRTPEPGPVFKVENMNKWPAILICIFLAITFIACETGEDDDCDDICDDNNDDSEADDHDNTTPTCTEGDVRCSLLDVPEDCIDGKWTTGEACPRLQYCNFGHCLDTLIELPRDESPHRDLIEWWYWTGNLADADGNIYGFELTFFYGARLFGIPAWMIHVGVVDEQTGAHDSSVWFDLKYPDENPEELHLESRSATADRWESGVYELAGDSVDYGYKLTLTDLKGPTFHGGNGSIRMSSRTCDSFYYSRTRIEVQGVLFKMNDAIEVTGEAWMDHQWGSFNPFVLIGWDWFSMQFDDGTEIMYFLFRGDEDDPSVIDMALGTYIDENGDQTTLSMDELEVLTLDEWTSPNTGGIYPQNWNVSVEGLDLDVDMTTEIPNQEFPNPMWNYWEGMMHIEGAKAGSPVAGMGFVELSGYAGRPLLWFLFSDIWENSK